MTINAKTLQTLMNEAEFSLNKLPEDSKYFWKEEFRAIHEIQKLCAESYYIDIEKSDPF